MCSLLLLLLSGPVQLTAHQQFRPFCASFFALCRCCCCSRMMRIGQREAQARRQQGNVAIVGQFDVCAFSVCFPTRVDSQARSRDRSSSVHLCPLPRIDQSVWLQFFLSVFRVTGMTAPPEGRGPRGVPKSHLQ